MPLTNYTCPDLHTIPCGQCISQCRMPDRCVSLSTLRAIWESERVWDGKPHVTDLLNGPLLTLLKVKEGYSLEPQSRAFALLGSTHHKLMEKSAEYPAEIRVEVMGIQGMADGLEPVLGDAWNLLDFKSWGSYKVAKALGMEENGRTPDPSGAKYMKGGKWGAAGTPKMLTSFRANPNKADLTNEIIQLNFYRIGLETGGMLIRDQLIQATVRDGGTVTAKGYGINRLIYMIRVPKVNNGEIMGWLLEKKALLMDAISDGTARLCTDDECWGGRRCRDYCEVWSFCTQGMELHK